MKISWLGQAGFRLVTDNGTVIMIDPYLSDTLRYKKVRATAAKSR